MLHTGDGGHRLMVDDHTRDGIRRYLYPNGDDQSQPRSQSIHLDTEAIAGNLRISAIGGDILQHQ